MSRPVILGVDPGVNRLGFAACDLATGAPVWCGPVSLTPEDHPDEDRHLHQRVGGALTVATTMRGLEPAILATEDPTHASRGKKQAAQWGGVMALIEAEALRRWPHIECWRVPIPTWKREVVGRGNATRDEYVYWADTAGWGPAATADADAAAAACIATWAYLTNQRQEEPA